jgi:predicted peptidase
MQRTIKTYASIQYIEYLPVSAPKGIILYYHGLGEVGKGIDAVEVNEIPKLFKAGLEKDYIVIAPYLPSGTSWPKNMIMALLDLINNYNLPNRIVTGLSLGGMATLSTLIFANEKFQRNNFFSAAGVVCGKTSATDLQPFMATPIRWWHGTNDAQLSINNARAFYDRLKAAGGQITLIEYVGMGHAIWSKAYNEEATSFWQWLASIPVQITDPKDETIQRLTNRIEALEGHLQTIGNTVTQALAK